MYGVSVAVTRWANITAKNTVPNRSHRKTSCKNESSNFVLFCLCGGPVTTPLLNLSRNCLVVLDKLKKITTNHSGRNYVFNWETLGQKNLIDGSLENKM